MVGVAGTVTSVQGEQLSFSLDSVMTPGAGKSAQARIEYVPAVMKTIEGEVMEAFPPPARAVSVWEGVRVAVVEPFP